VSSSAKRQQETTQNLSRRAFSHMLCANSLH
jgi:hypothetical protein